MMGVLSASCEKRDVIIRPYENPVGDKMPIVDWGMFQNPEMETIENYRLYQEAGFTMTIPKRNDLKGTEETLKICESIGLKAIIWIPNIKSIDQFVRDFRNNPATGGYLYADEPGVKSFSLLRKCDNEILALDSNSMIWTNLLPNYASAEQLGTSNYREYIRKFIEVVQPSMLSFDNYPFVEKDGEVEMRPGFYRNYEDVKDICGEYGVTFWSYLLAVPHLQYATPTPGQLALQMNSALAYGAQGLGYFGYQQSNTKSSANYHDPVVTYSGKLTSSYYNIKDVNVGVQSQAKHLLGMKLIGVWHTGSKIPEGTHRLSASDLPKGIARVNSNGDGLIVSRYTIGDNEYLMIVNRDYEYSQRVQIEKDSSVKMVDKRGRVVADKRNKIKINPGERLIFMI